MRKSWKNCLLLLLVFCMTMSLAGCGETDSADSEELPVLTVYAPSQMDDTITLALLRSESFAQQVERTLGMQLELHMLPSELDYNEVALLDFSGILLTDDPSWLVPLAENRRLERLSVNQEMKEREYGQYNNTQYGYVLEDPSCTVDSVVILANLQALRNMDNSQIHFTPEGILEFLRELKENFRIPLAVSGMPTGAGFTPLLTLFDMAPSGGREMQIEGNAVEYDKLSDRATDYLEYISLLYSEGLISADTMELSEYSCATLIAQNAAAIAVFTDEIYVELALQYAKEVNRELVSITLPVPNANIETGIFRRIVGYLSKDCADQDAAISFLDLLQCAVSEQTYQSENVLFGVGKYNLFSLPNVRLAKQDPREICSMYVYWLYQKEYLDMTYLDSAYSKIMLGEMAISEFATAAQSWMDDSSLLNMIAGKYWMETKYNN